MCSTPDVQIWTESNVSDVDEISKFLACSEISSLNSGPSVDVLVLCGNAILPIAEGVFSAIESRPDIAKTLVICGGVGHSTSFLYEAVRKSKYSAILPEINGLPEARVLERIMVDFFPRLDALVKSNAVKLIIEDKSTNCGANAMETRRVLDGENISPRSLIVVQDPTMSLRTVAAFKHTYGDYSKPPVFFGCPIFVPMLSLEHSTKHAVLSVSGLSASDLWESSRFLDLLMGEIPRLRDDEFGYGPKGKNYISHVDVPDHVENAWARLKRVLQPSR
ncbi:hypothetical protein LTR84_010970 [Exophiala bonariae]|uniref:DUF218 domain-containing protein n=1 Tax=Exophiala bonariae TaxID=1690606 RepID=A0AAV9NLK9_9EURO|nr:hypothetical protein LTR84_010970 [Exophiala bonariae]